MAKLDSMELKLPAKCTLLISINQWYLNYKLGNRADVFVAWDWCSSGGNGWKLPNVGTCEIMYVAVGGPLRFLLLMEGISNWQECFQCQDLFGEEVWCFFLCSACIHWSGYICWNCLTMRLHSGGEGVFNGILMWIWLVDQIYWWYGAWRCNSHSYSYFERRVNEVSPNFGCAISCSCHYVV